MYLKLEETIRWAVTFHSVLGGNAETLKAECFTLDETPWDQQHSTPGQGILVGEGLRGWHPCTGVGQERQKPWSAAEGGIPSAA